ncbi:MAG: hypothetical protein ACOX52_19425 [Verrucomicrobiota bacterium]
MPTRAGIPISISTMIWLIGRIGNHCLEATHDERAYDALLQALNLLGVLGVLAVHLMGSAIAG